MEEQDNISKGILFFLKEKEKEKKIKAMVMIMVNAACAALISSHVIS